MNIVVCVKRVPKSDTQVKVAGDGVTLDAAGVEYEQNPYDDFAVEAALQLREQTGEGTVTVVTFGSGDAQKELRNSLAMGCDQAVLIKDESGLQHDAYSTAAILAAQIQTMPHDLVLVGKQAIDSDQNQMGPRLAALLDLPCVSEIVELAFEGGAFKASRDIEGGREVVTCPTPCVLSANKGLNEPRYVNLKGIMAAKKKPLEEVAPAAIAPATAVREMTLPPARPPGRIVASVDELVAALKNEAKVL